MGEMYGRFTSKIVFDDLQRRSPNAGYQSKIPVSNEILYPRYSSQPAQTMSSISRMQGCFPGGSASILKKKKNKETQTQTQTQTHLFKQDYRKSITTYLSCAPVRRE